MELDNEFLMLDFLLNNFCLYNLQSLHAKINNIRFDIIQEMDLITHDDFFINECNERLCYLDENIMTVQQALDVKYNDMHLIGVYDTICYN
jgi:hypothetical protein